LRNRYPKEYALLRAERGGEPYEQPEVFERGRSKVRVGIAPVRTCAESRACGPIFGPRGDHSITARGPL
jgi:hypothetical protein